VARALWLPAVLRAAGLTVHEVSGWQSRGGATFDPRGIIVHATAGSRTAPDLAEIKVLLTGSASAPAPIAQLYLSRTGHWHVVASGRCNHALLGQRGTPLAGLGNTNLLGIEAANDNRGEQWPPAMYESYTRGVAAICHWMGWPVERAVGHKEHQPLGKTDPTFNMPAFRMRVASHLNSIASGGTMGFLADNDAAALAWRVDALHAGTPTVRGGPYKGEPMALIQMVNALLGDVAELKDRPAATVVLTEADRAAIVADLAAALRPVIDEQLDQAFRGGADADTP
jgi:hypothetical protein